ncbi:unnamed protein product [Lymnaea stagnalis]|uniref:Cytochrome P450 n=1 Tax=Lymnaea stagnalis TaxID=6523 RepID=A0AAV2HP96_LYMST
MAMTRHLLKTSFRQLTSGERLLPVRAASTMNVGTDQVEARPFEEIPGPKGIYKLPVIGTMLMFKPFTEYTAETFHCLMDKMFDTYGPIFRANFSNRAICVSNPLDFETVYRNEGKYPVRPPIGLFVQYFKRNNKTMGLSSLTGEEWHALRTPVNKRLAKADSATHYLEPQNAVADDFVKILGSRDLKNVDQADLFYRFASESIAVVTFNQRLGYLSDEGDKESVRFLEAVKSSIGLLNQYISGKALSPNWYRSSLYTEFERAFGLMFRISDKHVRKAKDLIEQKTRDGTLNTEEPNLLLSLASEKGLSEADVSNIMLSLYVGGTDSTAKNLQAFFYNLAKNPDKQEILRKEILEVIGDEGPLTDQALSKMTYLKACLKESFRLYYPTASGPSRVLPVDVVLSGYKVPAGTTLMMFNPRPSRLNFEDPDKYLPERWLRSNESRKQDSTNKMAVLPFGHGPKNCAGRRFAVQEIYLATAKVLQKMKIELEPESWNTKFKYTAFIEPEKPLKFKFSNL